MTYDFKNIEKKWQEKWYQNNLYKADDFHPTKEKKYILIEFPFPSGESLHVGHCYRYTVPDIYSRFLRMKGYNVLFPIGFDAFGLPAEEYARKTGKNPNEITKINIQNIKNDLLSLGLSFDWNREIATTDPEFYKWTQWIFIQFYRAGLATWEEIELWWCENLSTVLANEEVLEDENGNKISERGSYPVVKKKMKQWVLKMPEYGNKLLEGLDETEFPEFIKDMQKNWIGKSEGFEVEWNLADD